MRGRERPAVIDRGRGTPLILIPGIQGRWEWMTPAIEALAKRARVLTFSLYDASDGDGIFDEWLDLIEQAMDRADIARATVIGVSFGGLIALHMAARRPERTAGLILVSAPAPTPRIDAPSRRYMRFPRLGTPLFALRAARRLYPEIRQARPTWPSRARFAATYVGWTLRAPMSPPRMAAWVRAWMRTDLAADVPLVAAPTLIVTGEPHLDRVVPVSSTLQYMSLLPGSRRVTLSGTGHIGLVSKPEAFADVVVRFAEGR